MKTAAAMGVATAIAAGAHSVADSPVRAQASSEPRDETLETSENQLATAQDTAHPRTPSGTPSDLATDSARAPQAIQQASRHTGAGTAGSGHVQHHTASSAGGAPSVAPAPSSPPAADTPGTPAPSRPADSPPQAAQQPSGSSGPADGSDQSGQGGVLTGVVHGVGGVLGGLLG
ncbi:hypothetical protein GCM10018793_51250 [Streptomyces sulfonofaciens]|uniref:Uncharacterized protein n=2 Tax=Streptomyces sulfonofaciens TaxID=68272 RepID=A0A919GHQ5_9ACTN|nr:hypothetical protein GCM10018793_51250 [Streptomyces sulfonofaciens]